MVSITGLASQHHIPSTLNAMRKLRKLEIPFQRGFVQREIVAQSEALSRSEFGIKDPPGNHCTDLACEVGVVICAPDCYVQYQDGTVITLSGNSSEITGNMFAQLTVSTSSVYILPTMATDVSEVYIDFLPTDEWTYAPANNAIFFPTPLIADTQVHARYLFEA